MQGFLFGGGVFHRTISLGQDAHRWGAFNAAAVGLTAAWALGQALLAGSRNVWRQRSHMRLTDAAGEPLPGGDMRYVMLASTLKNLPLGLKPFGPHVEGLRLTVLDTSARRSLLWIPAVALGRQPKGRGYHQARARELWDRHERAVHSRRRGFPAGPLPRFDRPGADLRDTVSQPLEARVAAMLAREVRPEVARQARQLGEEAGALAVLFYGSNLRTGSLEGVLDYYVLLPGLPEKGMWPRVSYREWDDPLGGERLRAKIATMTLAKFAAAARGESRDTTIWARFVQPSALVWSRDTASTAALTEAISGAARTAARLAAALGPPEGQSADFWRALFQRNLSRRTAGRAARTRGFDPRRQPGAFRRAAARRAGFRRGSVPRQRRAHRAANRTGRTPPNPPLVGQAAAAG